MDQFILTEKTILKMLEEAFDAGYTSPVEFLSQETTRIYNKHIKKAKLTSCGEKPERLKSVRKLTPEEQKEINRWTIKAKNSGVSSITTVCKEDSKSL